MAVVRLKNGKCVGDGQSCYIVAEVGQNHQGDIKIAKMLIHVAKECGVDCVKFQKSNLIQKFNKKALDRPYKNVNSWGETYGEHKQHLEFSESEFRELHQYAVNIGIDFSASGMDTNSVTFLDSLELPYLKVASNDTSNQSYLECAAKTGRPLFVSSGMQSLKTMKKAYKILKGNDSQFCFLQCTSSYPTMPEDVHLSVIETFQREFPDVPIGYSGHEEGIAISIAAVAIGAKILERHITLDKNLKGSDHMSSLQPSELKELVKQVRIVERALGSPEKLFRSCESKTYEKLGKTIVATRKLNCGHVLTQDDICAKVADPKGWKCEEMMLLCGRVLKHDVDEDESIGMNDV